MAASQHSVNKPLVLFQLGIIAIMLVVVVMFATGNVPSTKFITSLIFPKASYEPKPIKVIEVRYYPYDSATQEQKTQIISDKLAADMADASRFHGYKDANAVPFASPSANRKVVRIYRSSPKTTGQNLQWFDSLNTILNTETIDGTPTGMKLCDYIVANKIDQVWGWFDVRAPGSVPVGDAGGYNQEFTQVFSNAIYPNQYPAPICGGRRTFVFFGFDQNRSVEEALHSFGHSVEAIIANTQGSDLFWTKWSGQTTPGIRQCGSVHVPPNGQSDYDYADRSDTDTKCEGWKPDGSGPDTYPTCTRWGCTEEGYLKWWFQNMPNANNGLTYQGKILPNWWDFLSETDVALANAVKANQFMTGQFANVVLPSANPQSQPSPTPTPKASPIPTPSPTPIPTPSPSVPPTSPPLPAGTQNTSTGTGMPIVDIKANGQDRLVGSSAKTRSVTLSWKVTGATSCVAKGAWSGAKTLTNTQVITLSTTVPVSDFILQCTGAGGKVWFDQVYVNPGADTSALSSPTRPAPVFQGKGFINGFDDTPIPASYGTVNFGTAPKIYVTKGSRPTFSWVTNAAWCGYDAKTPIVGSIVEPNITTDTTYGVSCMVSQYVPGGASATAYVK